MIEKELPTPSKCCRRCGRWFTPKEPDQEYGPVCARKIPNNHIDVRNRKGQVVAVIV